MKQLVLRALVPAIFGLAVLIAFQVHWHSERARKAARREIDQLMEKIDESRAWEEKERHELATWRGAVEALDEKEYEARITFLRKQLEQKNLPPEKEADVRVTIQSMRQDLDRVLERKEQVLKVIEKMEQHLKESREAREEAERRLRELSRKAGL